MDEQAKRSSAQPLRGSEESTSYEPLTTAAEWSRFMTAFHASAPGHQLPLIGMGNCLARHAPLRVKGERDPLGYSLFLAGLAEPEDSHRFCHEGGILARMHGLRDAVQVPARAHVTLCSLNRHDILDQTVIDAARAAARGFPCPSLPMVFDRAGSFAADGAYMLIADAATHAAVARLRKPLMRMLRRCGLKPDEVSTPHMTLVYNCGKVVAEHPVAPLPWTMRRFALVLSHVGNQRHEYLGEWRLPRH